MKCVLRFFLYSLTPDALLGATAVLVRLIEEAGFDHIGADDVILLFLRAIFILLLISFAYALNRIGKYFLVLLKALIVGTGATCVLLAGMRLAREGGSLGALHLLLLSVPYFLIPFAPFMRYSCLIQTKSEKVTV